MPVARETAAHKGYFVPLGWQLQMTLSRGAAADPLSHRRKPVGRQPQNPFQPRSDAITASSAALGFALAVTARPTTR